MPIKMLFCFQYSKRTSNWMTSSHFVSSPTWPDLKFILQYSILENPLIVGKQNSEVVKKGWMGSDCLDWSSYFVSCQLCDLALNLCFLIYKMRIIIRLFSYNWNEDSMKLYKCTVLKTMLGTLKTTLSWLTYTHNAVFFHIIYSQTGIITFKNSLCNYKNMLFELVYSLMTLKT